MKTLRNLAVAALLTLAAVVVNNQSVQALPYMDCFQAHQQCSIVPGGYFYVWEPLCTSDPDWEYYDVVYYWGQCHRDSDNAFWGAKFYCQPFEPSGLPVSCS